MDAINSYLKKEGDTADARSKLGKAEQFFLAVWPIPRLKERLQAIFFRSKFPLKILEIKKDIRLIHQTSKEIRRSNKVFSLLELILTLGNFLNGGTFRGGAFGFKLEALLKLADIKAVKSKTTFMHYLAKLLADTHSHLSNFYEDIPHVQEASKGKRQSFVWLYNEFQFLLPLSLLMYPKLRKSLNLLNKRCFRLPLQRKTISLRV
jgi:hypothetical protein